MQLRRKLIRKVLKKLRNAATFLMNGLRTASIHQMLPNPLNQTVKRISAISAFNK